MEIQSLFCYMLKIDALTVKKTLINVSIPAFFFVNILSYKVKNERGH